MTDLSETESLTDVVRPFLEFGGVNFDGGSAASTRQVVVMGVDDAAPVQTLAAIAHEDVNFAVLGQFLELRIDGREGDMAALALDQVVKVLGTDEGGHLAQDPHHLSALDGVSSDVHAGSLPVGIPLSVIILDSTGRMSTEWELSPTDLDDERLPNLVK